MSNYVEPIKNKTDLKRFLNYLKEKRYMYYVIFQLGMMTGLRISDILALNIDDVYNKTSFEVKEQKTGKHKKMLLQENTKNILKAYIKNYRLKQFTVDEEEPLFIGKKHKRLDRTIVYRMFNEACKACNININIGTHTMRKTFGYHHYQQFKDVVLLQKIFNHSAPQITLRYIGIYQEEIDDSYANFNLDKSLNLISVESKKENNKEVRIVNVPIIKKEVQTVYKTKVIKDTNETNNKIKNIIDLLKNVSESESKNSKFANFLLDFIENSNETSAITL